MTPDRVRAAEELADHLFMLAMERQARDGDDAGEATLAAITAGRRADAYRSQLYR